MTEVLHSFYVALWEPRPPSVNNMYRTGFRGRRVLSKAGQEFKSAMTAAVVAEVMAMPWKRAIDAVYFQGAGVRCVLGLNLPIFNNSWKPGGITEKGNLQSPYKKLDGTSYIKALEDAVVDGTGIDDSCHLSFTVEKIDSSTPFVEIAYEVISPYALRSQWHRNSSR